MAGSILHPVAAAALLFAGMSHAETVRVAVFNASMSRDAPGALARALLGEDDQIAAVAQVIRAADPDILVLNEFDYGEGVIETFARDWLGGAYPHVFVAPSNTGVATGLDLNADGTVGTEPGGFAYANDAQGFGLFEGQYGMAVLSRLPIRTEAARTFRSFLWADMPDARLPVTEAGESFYPEEALAILRLSSKSHWDVPVAVGGDVLHVLVSHPTPPVFDGPEDRNGRRNADEIRFWADYVQGAEWIYDDAGTTGGLATGAHFVIAGDLNADPADGDSLPGAVQQLLDLPLIDTSVTPSSDGGSAAAAAQGGANAGHAGDPARDTADFGDDPGRNGPGNLRVDYVLPSSTLRIEDAGIVWPVDGPLARAADRASDHRLVWIDVTLP
jgi:endonuclease/exonuclease/phosphatase family metal-dependent hydrolase